MKHVLACMADDHVSGRKGANTNHVNMAGNMTYRRHINNFSEYGAYSDAAIQWMLALAALNPCSRAYEVFAGACCLPRQTYACCFPECMQ